VAIGLVGLTIAGPVLAQSGAATGAAGAAENDPLEAAAWLAGCWEAASPDGLNAAEEQWMAPRGGLMVGMSRSIRGGSARGYELATIRADETGRLVYHALPSGQAPADFPARSIGEGRLEFVNVDHDFPQKIVYARLDPDLVHAAVFGDADGAEPSFLIPYRRAACPGS
jgi:hypothetical protein